MATMAMKDMTIAAGESTVIGPSILINGRLSGDEDLTVRGRVEGEISLSKTLIVEQSGVVKANVAVKNAIVSGVVVGNITATESVEITREGRMVGDVHAPRVIIVDGARFRGRIDMGEADAVRPAGERPATRPVVARAASRPTVSAPPRPPAPPRPVTASSGAGKPSAPPKPLPPPPPPTAGAASPAGPVSASKPEDLRSLPPVAPLLGEAGKKKIVVRKKGR